MTTHRERVERSIREARATVERLRDLVPGQRQDEPEVIEPPPDVVLDDYQPPDRRAAWLAKQEARALEGRLHQAELRRQEREHIEAHYRAQADAWTASLAAELDERTETTLAAVAEFVAEWTNNKFQRIDGRSPATETARETLDPQRWGRSVLVSQPVFTYRREE